MVTKRGLFSNYDPDDITTYPTARPIYKSGKFSADERKAKYKRRGKGPAGVIDGEYNDTYCDPGDSYNYFERDWEAYSTYALSNFLNVTVTRPVKVNTVSF